MRIAVLCSGSYNEGLGHLYRSFSFVRHVQTSHDVQVIARTDAAFSSIFAGLTPPAVLVNEDTALPDALAAVQPDVTVLDLLDLPDRTFERIRRLSPVLASISPVFRHAAATDLFFTRGRAPAGLTGPRIHAGLDYTIINAHCRPISDAAFAAAVSSPALPIMMSFGGADADNHSRLVLEVLREVEQPLLLWLMLGDGYLHSHDDLVAAIRATPQHEIIMARTNRSMWAIAANCALAILSSGLSTVEALYAGLPVIAMHRIDDPSRQVATDYDPLCLFGGRFSDGSYREVRALVEALHRDRDRLHSLRSRQKGIIDGRGVERVLAAIEAYRA